MNGITEAERNWLRTLSPHAAVAANIFRAAQAGLLSALVSLRSLCDVSGVAQARAVEVQKVLFAAAEFGLFQTSDSISWKYRGSQEQAVRLALLLEAIALYQREVHVDRDVVSVVLTEPVRPSQLAERLEASLKGTHGIEQTTRHFFQLAEQATQRLTVMTPFLDENAAPFVRELFESAHALRRELIVRSDANGVLPAGLTIISASLKERGVRVFNFRRERLTGGNETFHAKVVLADDTCYVGSFNMTRWSMQYSLELGLASKGAAARRIGEILDAIIDVSERVPLCH